MTTTQDPDPGVAPRAESSTGSPGWQPYRYGEAPPIRQVRRSRSGGVAVVLGALALLFTIGSVVAALAWSGRASGLVLAATAAVLALCGVICAVPALAQARMGAAAGIGAAIAGTAVSAAGFTTALLWTVVLVLTTISTPSEPARAAPVVLAPLTPSSPTSAPVVGAERRLRLEVTGTVPTSTISYQFAGTSGGDTVPTPVPWAKDVDGGTTEESFSINASSQPGQQGSLTCSISDAGTGAVLDTKTVQTDGSPQSSAYTSCHFYG